MCPSETIVMLWTKTEITLNIKFPFPWWFAIKTETLGRRQMKVIIFHCSKCTSCFHCSRFVDKSNRNSLDWCGVKPITACSQTKEKHSSTESITNVRKKKRILINNNLGRFCHCHLFAFVFVQKEHANIGSHTVSVCVCVYLEYLSVKLVSLPLVNGPRADSVNLSVGYSWQNLPYSESAFLSFGCLCVCSMGTNWMYSFVTRLTFGWLKSISHCTNNLAGARSLTWLLQIGVCFGHWSTCPNS